MPRINLNDNSFGALMMTGASLSFAVKAGDEVIVVAIRELMALRNAQKTVWSIGWINGVQCCRSMTL